VVVYDGPAAAIRDAQLVLGGREGGGLRLGLQIAEVPRTGPVVDGAGVEAAVSLADRAAPGQLLVSTTVHDLVGGSGLPLEPAGDDAYRLALPTPAR
jgi:class 3 adenylate cyclase